MKPLAHIIVIGLLIAIAAVIVWQSPDESVLGDKIKVIYVHVALTWTGVLGFGLAGVLGFGVALTHNPLWAAWMHALGRLALVFFVAGFLMSMWASKITWGPLIAWDEPRTQSTLLIIGLGLVVLALYDWTTTLRYRGLLYTGLAAMLFVSTRVPRILHPTDAARTSPSGIRGTFLSLSIVFALVGAWILWQFRPTRRLQLEESIQQIP